MHHMLKRDVIVAFSAFSIAHRFNLEWKLCSESTYRTQLQEESQNYYHLVLSNLHILVFLHSRESLSFF